MLLALMSYRYNSLVTSYIYERALRQRAAQAQENGNETTNPSIEMGLLGALLWLVGCWVVLGWLVACFGWFGWLVGLFVGWFVRWLVGWLGWVVLVGLLLVGWLVNIYERALRQRAAQAQES